MDATPARADTPPLAPPSTADVVALEVKMSDPNFSLIVVGRKTVEARSASWWAANRHVNALNLSLGEFRAQARIQSAQPYPSFRHLVEGEGLANVAPKAASVDDALAELRRGAGAADELQSGVVALRLRVVDV
jgi:ASC-1-like (ASCH) protein